MFRIAFGSIAISYSIAMTMQRSQIHQPHHTLASHAQGSVLALFEAFLFALIAAFAIVPFCFLLSGMTGCSNGAAR